MNIRNKHKELRKNGTFNHNANMVSAEIFSSSLFFDPHDIIQVKYEMLRAVEKDHLDVSSASAEFGFSRVSFYLIKKEFDSNGIAGLLPKKRGPKGSRKLNAEDIEYARNLAGKYTKPQIVILLRDERGVEISRRTLERQLATKKNF